MAIPSPVRNQVCQPQFIWDFFLPVYLSCSLPGYCWPHGSVEWNPHHQWGLGVMATILWLEVEVIHKLHTAGQIVLSLDQYQLYYHKHGNAMICPISEQYILLISQQPPHNFKFWLGMPKFGSVWFSGVFAWTAHQNQMAGRGCIELWTRPTEPGSNLVWTELNLQSFVDVLSGKKECREVLTSVCYAGKHVGGTCQMRNACLVVVSILTPVWCWWYRCRHFRAVGVMENFLVKFSWLALCYGSAE